MPQDLALYEDLNAAENLEYWGGAYGLRGGDLRARVAEVLERTGAGHRVHDSAGLGRELGRLLGDETERAEMSRRAAQVLEANRGALERSVSLLLSVVDARASRSSTGVG